MITIYKYPFTIMDIVNLELPEGASIVHVDYQEHLEQSAIWAIVDTEQPLEKRQFRLYGTGHMIPDMERLQFMGTHLTCGGRLVWHLFEVLGQ